jgi:hypothetical protein
MNWRCALGLHELQAWNWPTNSDEPVPYNPNGVPTWYSWRECSRCGASWLRDQHDGLAPPEWKRVTFLDRYEHIERLMEERNYTAPDGGPVRLVPASAQRPVPGASAHRTIGMGASMKAKLLGLVRALLSGAGWVLGFVVTWGVAFRLAYAHYGGDWFAFWVIVVAWLAVSFAVIIWLFGRQADPEGEAERIAYRDNLRSILDDDSLGSEEVRAAVEALGPEPQTRLVSRASVQRDRLVVRWRARRRGRREPAS